MRSTSLSNKWRCRHVQIWIPLIYGITLLVVSSFHSGFEEYDGVMQLFAGKDIVAGIGFRGWVSHFWPPLYSLLMGLGALAVPGFLVGKLISIGSAVLLLYGAYELAFLLSGQKSIGLLTQLFLAVNPLYFVSSFQVENHMLDSLFFVFAFLLLLKSLDRPSAKGVLLVGLLSGFACLSRYTSYVLVPMAIFSLMLVCGARERVKILASFTLGFVLVSLPWWIYNGALNGSPFSTWQYLNVGEGIFPDRYQWLWSDQSRFNGVVQVILARPRAYLGNLAFNIIASGRALVKTGSVLALFVIPAIFDSLISLRFRYLSILYGGLVLFIILISQAFVFNEVFLSWVVIMTILSLIFLNKFLVKSQENYEILKRHHFKAIVIIFLSVAGLAFTFVKASSYIARDEYDNGQLTCCHEIDEALIRHDPDICTKCIMSAHPTRAYTVGANWLRSPSHYEGTVAGLVCYEGLCQKVRAYAPKFPANMNISSLRADYLICDPRLLRELPQFSFLLEPDSPMVPETFEVVYSSPEVAVYEIARQ